MNSGLCFSPEQLYVAYSGLSKENDTINIENNIYYVHRSSQKLFRTFLNFCRCIYFMFIFCINIIVSIVAGVPTHWLMLYVGNRVVSIVM